MKDYDVTSHPLDTASSTHGTGPEHLTDNQRNRLIASLFSRPGENPTRNLIQDILNDQLRMELQQTTEALIEERNNLQDELLHQKYEAPHKRDNPPASSQLQGEAPWKTMSTPPNRGRGA